jgi:hypothetical protein
VLGGDVACFFKGQPTHVRAGFLSRAQALVDFGVGFSELEAEPVEVIRPPG